MENSHSRSAIPRPSGIPRLSKLPARSGAANLPAGPGDREITTSQNFSLNRSADIRQIGGNHGTRSKAAAKSLTENGGYNALSQRDSADDIDPLDPSSKKRTGSENAMAEVPNNIETQRNSELAKAATHRRPRPSLADRTIETLSKIPPSPSPRRRQSGFFNQEAPTGASSRPASSLSRSRPSTSIGYHPPTPSKPWKGDRPPDVTPSRRSVSSYAPRSVPHPQKRSNLPSDTTPSKVRPSSPTKAPRTRLANPSGKSSTNMSTPPKLAARPSRRAPPVTDTMERSSHVLPNGDTMFPRKASAAVRAPKPRSTEQHTPKSSAALRETIAKAKAAAAAKSKAKSTLDTGFEIQVDTDAKSLRKRITMALEDGKLNIAALGLTEIPKEVLNMYDYGSLESVDITKINAADNQLRIISDEVFPDIDTEARLKEDEDFLGLLFGGLEYLDLHGNQLAALPKGLRQLDNLTTLNLSKNRLTNTNLEIIAEVASLRELRLAENALDGTFPTSLCNLLKLELLDLHGNAISEIPNSIKSMSSLSVLKVSGNKLSTLPWHALASLPITSLDASKNRFSGLLFPSDDIPALVALSSLDVALNALTALTTTSLHNLPNIQTLSVAHNRLKSLPDISILTSLTTLSAGNNQLSCVPDGMAALQGLKTVDFSHNSIRAVEQSIGSMQGLKAINLEGNPLRMGEKRLLKMSTEELKEELRQRGSGEREEAD